METFLLFITEKSEFLLVAAAVFLLLEFLRPARAQKKWREGSSLDLIYFFLLPMLAYPLSVLFNAWLIDQFWSIPPNPVDTGSLQQTVTQIPKHGQAEIQPDGKVIYHPDSGFLGLDRFTITTEYNQNVITRTYMVNVAQPDPEHSGSDANTSPAIYIAEVDKQISGKVTEGVSGFFFRMRQAIDEWHLALQLLLATFLIDLVGYWRHRLMHTKFLWPFHAIHHSSKELDWLSNERFHPVNMYITYLLSISVLILFFEDPFVFALAVPLRRAYGMFVHSNVKISYGPLNTVFVSPLFHHWHHAANGMADKNYCAVFSILDRIFGTYYLPRDKKEPETLGLPEDNLANRFWPQFIYPFTKLTRMIAR